MGKVIKIKEAVEFKDNVRLLRVLVEKYIVDYGIRSMVQVKEY